MARINQSTILTDISEKPRSGKLTNEDIAKFSGLPLEVVEELANSLQTV